MATVLGKEQLDRAAHRLWVEVVVRCPFDLRGAPVGAAHLPYLLVLVDGQGHERFALPRPGGVVEGSRHARRCCRNLEGENSLSLDFELVDFPERHAVVSVPGNLPLERLEFCRVVPAICGSANGFVVVYAEEEPCVLLASQNCLVAQRREVPSKVLKAEVVFGLLELDDLGLVRLLDSAD